MWTLNLEKVVQIVPNSVNYVNQCLVGKPDLDEGIILRNGASVEHVVCFVVHAFLDPVLEREWHHIPFFVLSATVFTERWPAISNTLLFG